MTRSMTAYGRAERDEPWGRLVCELRSLNHRYLDATFRLPETLRFIEPALRERLRARLRRGKVDCTVRLERPASVATGLDIDPRALEELVTALEAVAARLPVAAGVDPLDVLSWPGIVREPALDPDELAAGVHAVFDATLEALIDHRQREGAQLRDRVQERLAAIEASVDAVAGCGLELAERLRSRLAERAAALATELEPQRLEQEVALLAQKADISEEIDRLKLHLAAVHETLEGEAAAGRRLDFLAQELNREANTLASKASDAELTRHTVDMKVLIEQVREQVQNIK